MSICLVDVVQLDNTVLFQLLDGKAGMVLISKVHNLQMGKRLLKLSSGFGFCEDIDVVCLGLCWRLLVLCGA